MFHVQLVWNREFDWCSRGGGHPTPEAAKAAAVAMMDMGDGACVKKVRVLDDDGKVVWSYG